MYVDDDRMFELVFGEEWQSEAEARGRVEARDGRLAVFSSDKGHYSSVRLEAWNAEPVGPDGSGRPDASWQEVGTAVLETETGIVRLTGPVAAREALFLIGPPLFEYRVAVYTKDAHLLLSDRGSISRGAEKWLLRFWPVRDVYDPHLHLRPSPYTHDGTSIDDPGPRPVSWPIPVSEAAEWPAMRVPAAPVMPPGPHDTFRIAEELNPERVPTTGSRDYLFTPPLDAKPGTTCRVWQWDDAERDTPLGAMAAYRQILAHDVINRRVFVTALVTVLRRDGDWYDLRGAEPVEAARVLYAEQAWGGLAAEAEVDGTR
ncbi:hypothetical protein ACFY05_42405 [Microtetraspora fusca]|uniref:Uncharacterized protein n=1 Tax=Microtetraspora fusca TaxID=1997 RepID=A0ABW6VKJ0_MICFU